MAAKKTKKPKPKPPIGFFTADGELFFVGRYEENGKVTPTYHNKAVQDSLEPKWSEHLTEAARTVMAEDPDNGLLRV